MEEFYAKAGISCHEIIVYYKVEEENNSEVKYLSYTYIAEE